MNNPSTCVQPREVVWRVFNEFFKGKYVPYTRTVTRLAGIEGACSATALTHDCAYRRLQGLPAARGFRGEQA